jgi:hypothetical protein
MRPLHPQTLAEGEQQVPRPQPKAQKSYPALQVHALAAMLPKGECKFAGQSTHTSLWWQVGVGGHVDGSVGGSVCVFATGSRWE